VLAGDGPAGLAGDDGLAALAIDGQPSRLGSPWGAVPGLSQCDVLAEGDGPRLTGGEDGVAQLALTAGDGAAALTAGDGAAALAAKDPRGAS